MTAGVLAVHQCVSGERPGRGRGATEIMADQPGLEKRKGGRVTEGASRRARGGKERATRRPTCLSVRP